MRHLLHLATALAFVALPAQARPLSSQAAPSQNKAYVGGAFVTERPTFSAAFVLTNQEDGREYTIPFSSRLNTKAGNTETLLIDLPPGTYRVTHWIVFNTWWGTGALTREFKRPMPESRMTEPLQLNAGDVLFLGSFVTDDVWTNGYFSSSTSGRWQGEPISLSEARAKLGAAYPRFADAHFSCLTCAP